MWAQRRTFWTGAEFTKQPATALRMSGVFAAGLGGQNMVIDVSIQTEISRGRNPVNSEVLVFAVPPKAF